MIEINVLYGVPKYAYAEQVSKLLKPSKDSKILYISLNKTAQSLSEELKLDKTVSKNIIFIDCITGLVSKPPADSKKIYYFEINSPLDGLLKKAEDIIKSEKPSMLVFDSISALSVYHLQQDVEKFIHKLAPLLSVKKIGGFFLTTSQNLESGLTADLAPLFDKVENLEKEAKDSKPVEAAKDSSAKMIFEGDIIIGRTETETALDRTCKLLNELVTTKGFNCIYVTFNRPYSFLQREFKKRKVNVDNIYFYDTVTRLSVDADSEYNCTFLDSPQRLDYLLSFLKSKLDTTKGKKAFLILDTLTNVLNYNTHEETIMFVQALTNKLRITSIGGSLIVISASEQDQIAYEDFKKFVDFSSKF